MTAEMRTYKLGLGAVALIAAAACDGRDQPAPGAGDPTLAQDLALAQATSSALTLPGTAGPRTHVVSAVELLPHAGKAASRAAASPRRAPRSRSGVRRASATVAPRPTPAVLAEEPVAAPAPVEEVAEVVAKAGDGQAATAAEPEWERTPAAEPVLENPRPGPIFGGEEVGGGVGSPRRRGGWGGVVIRGGAVDGDHCERHRNRVPMISINVRGPIGQGTFPRY